MLRYFFKCEGQDVTEMSRKNEWRREESVGIGLMARRSREARLRRVLSCKDTDRDV